MQLTRSWLYSPGYCILHLGIQWFLYSHLRKPIIRCVQNEVCFPNFIWFCAINILESSLFFCLFSPLWLEKQRGGYCYESKCIWLNTGIGEKWLSYIMLLQHMDFFPSILNDTFFFFNIIFCVIVLFLPFRSVLLFV